MFLAEVYAHQGRLMEAAKLFKDNRMNHRAMAMYADLRMFDLAQECLNSSSESSDKDKAQLMRMKAEWASKINEPRVAAEMYLVAGEKVKAIQIVGENKWTDMYVRLMQCLILMLLLLLSQTQAETNSEMLRVFEMVIVR